MCVDQHTRAGSSEGEMVVGKGWSQAQSRTVSDEEEGAGEGGEDKSGAGPGAGGVMQVSGSVLESLQGPGKQDPFC